MITGSKVRLLALTWRKYPACNNHCRCFVSSSSDPLRILFCGADAFSVASLEALRHEQAANPALIKSIDVLCKTGKRTGRGLKKYREVPIATAAQKLSLPLHQLDTFTEWQPPLPNDEPINLVIAVSFGLLIPSRILKASKYGGLNVHPSMLPDFRGAAPIHWALLHGCKTTGISLQTLHPHHFDQGRVLAQTPLPGLDIPCSETITPPELSAFLAPRAAELLVSSLRDRVFSSDAQSQVHTTLLRPAPKIVPEHRHIDWSLWSADEILRRHRVIGPLWNNGASGSSPGLHMRRIIWSSGFQLMPPSFDNAEPGMGRVSGSDPHLYIQTADKQTLRAESAIVEGEVAKSASSAANKANMVDSRSSFMIGSSKYMKLWSPFS